MRPCLACGACAIGILIASALAACGSPTLAPATPAAAPEAPTTAASLASIAFERQQRERALALTRQGALADAADAWDILALLRPESTDYVAKAAETRRQIDAALAERLPRAAQAARRGELDAAAQQYLAILALSPGQAQAADALRAIERERVRRTSLGQLSRHTLTRRAVIASEMAAASAEPDRNDIEYASMLAEQGEFDEAIGLLERRVTADKRDARSRDLLAEVQCRKGESLLAQDAAAATAAYRQCLRWRPKNPLAIARLKALRAAAAAGPSAALRSAAAGHD